MIKAIYSGAEFLEGAVAGEEVGLVLDSTSFYAEQGGQVLCCSHKINHFRAEVSLETLSLWFHGLI